MSYGSSDRQSQQKKFNLSEETSLQRRCNADKCFLVEYNNDALVNASYSDLECLSYHSSPISQPFDYGFSSFTDQSINILNQNNSRLAYLPARDINLRNLVNEESDKESQEDKKIDLHEAIIKFILEKSMLEEEREIIEYFLEEIPPNY